jgi:hypothetical protein
MAAPVLANSAANEAPAQGCPSCGVASEAPGTTAPSFVYAIGRIEPRFPRLSVEKEFAQATGRAETTKLTDRQALHKVLSERHNRYLARQLCWVMTIQGLETYILVPRDPADFDLLIEAVRAAPGPGDLDVVIGLRGPIAPPEMCNGLMLPVLVFEQIYSFGRQELIAAIPKPEKTTAKEFAPAAEELFDRIAQIADNAGATDEHRALNYCLMRYKGIYSNAADAFARNESLTAVHVQTSSLSGTSKVLDVVLSYTNRSTDVTERYCVSVDVQGMFPFIHRALRPYVAANI